MKERIQHIIKAESLTNLQFAQLIESSPATVTHLLSGRNKPSIEMVANIARAFPHYNLRWLILGEGAIYSKGVVDEASSCASEAQNSTTPSNELPFDATDAPNSATIVQPQQTIVITPAQPQSPEAPATPMQNVSTTSSATVTAPEPSPTKLIVCLPDGTFSEYTRK